MMNDPRIWVQVYMDVRRKLDTQELKPGDRVSIGYVSQEWGIARQTVAKAFLRLENENRIRRYPGAGYVVLPPET